MCLEYWQGLEMFSNGVSINIIQLDVSRPTTEQRKNLVISKKCMLLNYIEAAALIKIGEEVKGEGQVCWRCNNAITTKVKRIG
jgi:hypothetical protein